jgi:hypothetical protein
MSLSEKEEVELLYALKQLPDFDCLPIPDHWFKKYNLAPRGTIAPREFMESNYTMSMAVAPKDLPPLIIDEPQQGGKLVKFMEVPEVPVEVRSRPFEWDQSKPFPAVLVKDDDPIVDPRPYEALSSLRHTSFSETETPQQDQPADQGTGSPVQQSYQSEENADLT